jgi:hypothetical protein
MRLFPLLGIPCSIQAWASASRANGDFCAATPEAKGGWRQFRFWG